MSTHRKHNEGVALLLTLLFIVLVAVIVAEYAYESRVEAARARADIEGFRAYAAAKGAVAAGTSLVAQDLLAMAGAESGSADNEAVANYDGLDEPWAEGIPCQMVDESAMQCLITDEFGKLNLNALVSEERGEPNEMLREALRFLFDARGVVDNPTDAIVDWLDADEEPGALGAEAAYYQELGVPYACRNGAFTTLEELFLVRGMTPDAFFGDPEEEQLPLSELLTVHGDPDGHVNVNTAPLEVLDALGQAIGQPGLAQMILEDREVAGFVNEEEFRTRLGLQPADGGGEDADLFGVESRCFRVRGHGLCGRSKVRIDAYLWRDERQTSQPLRLLEWRVMK